jgi:DNA end-binding protein Ku
MAARATGSGVISFGMVSIPVKLYSTGGKLVEKQDRVKGDEFAKGQYVLFTSDEMIAMAAKPTNEIEITGFVASDQVSAVYVEKVNYLGSDKRAARSYHLLGEAMPHADIKKDELDLAIQLGEQVSSQEFKPEKYTDDVRHHMLEVIERKVNGDKIVVAPEEQPEAKIIDIMQALKAQGKTGSRSAKQAPKKSKTESEKKPSKKKQPAKKETKADAKQTKKQTPREKAAKK